MLPDAIDVTVVKTTFEDIEVLLENKKYLDCPRCEDNIKNNRRLLNADCVDCDAWGALPNPRYVEAAKRAGLPLPPSLAELGKQRLDNYFANSPLFGLKPMQGHRAGIVITDDPFKP